MRKADYVFCERKVECLFAADFMDVEGYGKKEKIVIITDENVYAAHIDKFKGFSVITIASGEVNKTQRTVDNIIEQLLTLEADKQSLIIGVGGGVITDIAG